MNTYRRYTYYFLMMKNSFSYWVTTALLVSTFCTSGLVSAKVATAPVLAAGVVAQQGEDSFYKQFRKQSYQAYPSLQTTAKSQKTGEYSPFENPTGIHFKKGDEIVVKVPNLKGQEVFLRVVNLGTKDWADSEYPLKNGTNKISIQNDGNGYIKYYTDKKSAPSIGIEIEGGTPIGYFDAARHTNEDWKKLLSKAQTTILDIKGKYTNLAYPVKALKEQCPENGAELIKLYDDIILLQLRFMGLEKYKRMPKNHMQGRVIWEGFMHADGIGAAFHNDTLTELCHIEKLKENGLWGVAHEFGHVNQVRPGMKWVSTTEVTNNLFSIWSKYKFSPAYINLEHERHNDGKDHQVTGGRFNSFLEAALIANEQWLCQKGPDKMTEYENGGDHFVKLCPLWQLQLYFNVAKKGNPDFYGDIFEIVRNQKDDGISDGQHQLNFMKNVCDTNKQDVTDFFKAVGMLKPINKDMDDYSRAQLTITQEQCDELVQYAKKYPKPDSSVIYYITSASAEAYRDKLPVQGEFDKGVKTEEQTRVISKDVWKNVTVFETYAGDKLTNIAIIDTDFYPEKTATRVQYPEGSTRIEAVSWDGKRTLVTGKR